MKNVSKFLFVLFLVSSLSAFCQSKKEMILSYEKHEAISEEKKRELIGFLSSRDNPDYYVFPDIPRRKLKKASKRAYVSKMDVLALIDNQLMGPAKDFFLIGTSGIYFKNGSLADNPGRHFISFNDFRNKGILLKGDNISIGELVFDCTGTWAEREFIIELLKDLQKLI